ncbi:glutathione S-transferase 1-like [Sitophilus oryzae]|uniref:Glutathione S-transferase 1-like n=1 Tax=Sitophilus oryzae TaxID=7048 RepID=A0A678TPT3_SITOR|nr:glutathione S-transferase 1-like [Sitophilus oryzae]AVR54965.1 glutathione-s-transferase epsilon class 12 [Sitophilus oryzae]
MAPKLYGVDLSPPTRAVLMCAHTLNLKLDYIKVDFCGEEHLQEPFIKRSPQHEVPVLEDDDGFILTDSHAIMIYLVEKYGKDDSLYPRKDVKQTAIINHKLYFDCSTLFIRVKSITKPMVLYGVIPSKEKLDDLKEALELLNTFLEKSKTKFVAGNSLTIADFSIMTSVGFADNVVHFADYPQVKAYMERMEKLPCYGIKENIDGMEDLTRWISSRQKELNLI